jgi:hypothetical protein
MMLKFVPLTASIADSSQTTRRRIANWNENAVHKPLVEQINAYCSREKTPSIKPAQKEGKGLLEEETLVDALLLGALR